MPNKWPKAVRVPYNVLLTLYAENGFRGESLKIDGGDTTSNIGGQTECINLSANGRNFGGKTSSFKVLNKTPQTA